LFGAIIDHPIALQYRRFPLHIRSYSLSDECLHGKWVGIDEAQYMLPHDILEVIEPVYASLQQGHDNAQVSCFMECTAVIVSCPRNSRQGGVVIPDTQNAKDIDVHSVPFSKNMGSIPVRVPDKILI